MKRVAAVAFALAGVLAPAAGCGDDARDLFVVQYDGGSEGGDATGGPDALVEVDPTLGGPCTEDAQCDDQIPCTADRCDQTLSRCRNTPDDELCSDGVYCNGKERCVLRQGCAPGPVVTCQDDNPCTIDRCIEETKGCEHAQRDADGDGDPDNHCVGMKDCDDLDPTISSKATEVCGNGRDDDCDGTVDEADCATAQNDVCSTAKAITAPGTYLLSTVAAKHSYASACSVANPAASRDIALKITAPAGNAVNALVTVRGYGPPNEVAVALADTCADPPAGQVQPLTPIACGHIAGLTDARAIKRHLAAGESVYAIVTTQAESSLDVKVDFLPDADAPSNETCATAQAIPAADLEKPFTVSVIDPAEDVATACERTKTGDLVYAFDLATPRDVKIFSSTISGSGRPVVGIQDASCVEQRCRVGGVLPVFARNLSAGTHYFSVSGTSQVDANVLVQTYPPTAPPPTQSCATAPSIAPNGSVTVNLGDHEDTIKDDCLGGGPTAVYKLDLAVESDVLAIGRFPQNETGAVSIHDDVACTSATRIACTASSTPARVSRRKLPAGTYWIVITDELGQTAQLDVLVRPYAAPTSVTTAEGCLDAVAIPEAGGFFTGDNNGAKGDFDASCDAAGVPIGGAPDRMLKLVLAQKRRVVFDMGGSFYTTLLDVRSGATCPGAEIANGCFVGFGAQKSFLDVPLDAGTYWVQVDGYAGDYGKWNLDVRVLDPK